LPNDDDDFLNVCFKLSDIVEDAVKGDEDYLMNTAKRFRELADYIENNSKWDLAGNFKEEADKSD